MIDPGTAQRSPNAARSPEKLCLRHLAARANPCSGPFGLAWRAGTEQGRLRKPASGESRIISEFAAKPHQIAVSSGECGLKRLSPSITRSRGRVLLSSDTIRRRASRHGLPMLLVALDALCAHFATAAEQILMTAAVVRLEHPEWTPLERLQEKPEPDACPERQNLPLRTPLEFSISFARFGGT